MKRRHLSIVLLLGFHTVLSETFNVFGKDDPIIVSVGEDAVLECQLVSDISLDTLDVRWFTSDSASPVHLYTDGQDRPDVQDKGYQGRTELFKDEFSHGNASLKLKNIKISDEGSYTCSIDSKTRHDEAVIDLRVADEFFLKINVVNVWLVIFWVLVSLVIMAVTVDVMVHRNEDKKIKELQEFLTLEGFNELELDCVSVTLDMETAHPWLEVSEDLKSLRHAQISRRLPDTEKRFRIWLCALGSQGFTSGRHYWEVEVVGNQHWRLGVALESVERKGWIIPIPENGFWIIEQIMDQFSISSSPQFPLPVDQIPRKVGVYLSYESGTISFYNVDTKSHLHTFTGNKFTEKLYPFFWTRDPNKCLRICS
ncbi:erythroid membrane-associated protein-like isoform X3 [Stegostoma tigrinum]|uniref:erythroid membrane-associated protein-like isoform X3 n=1 Tax=Stegostoma tigrinum TaxID=3053191 RepID=UPI00202B8339|nr:erythroid membrane-associated protein-like isoform X3 [Stegostoma tigrinum]